MFDWHNFMSFFSLPFRHVHSQITIVVKPPSLKSFANHRVVMLKKPLHHMEVMFRLKSMYFCFVSWNLILFEHQFFWEALARGLGLNSSFYSCFVLLITFFIHFDLLIFSQWAPHHMVSQIDNSEFQISTNQILLRKANMYVDWSVCRKFLENSESGIRTLWDQTCTSL